MEASLSLMLLQLLLLQLLLLQLLQLLLLQLLLPFASNAKDRHCGAVAVSAATCVAAATVAAVAAAPAAVSAPLAAAAAATGCSLRLRFDRESLVGRCALGRCLGDCLESVESSVLAATEDADAAAAAADDDAVAATAVAVGLDVKFDVSLLLRLLRLLRLLQLSLLGDLSLLLFLFIALNMKAANTKHCCLCSAAPQLHEQTPPSPEIT